MICPNCQDPDLDDDAIFCSNCGADIQTFTKVHSYNNSKIDNLVHQQVNGIVLKQETIDLYQKLTSEVNELRDVPQKLQDSKKSFYLWKTI